MRNAILFGNGINRAGGNSVSWENLLERLSPLEKMRSSSNTRNYECIYLSGCGEEACEVKEGLRDELRI